MTRLIARDWNEIGQALWLRRPGYLDIAVRIPVAPRRRIIPMIECRRRPGFLVDVRLTVRWAVTAYPCRCGSGIMRSVFLLGCSMCSIPAAPLIARAALYPGRLV